MPIPIVLALGSNLGDREANIQTACKLLQAEVNILKVSSLIETKPYGVENQPNFLNGAIYGETGLSPMELLAFVKKTEKKCGRYETFHWGPRVIDIDIVFYDNIKYVSPVLTIPHKDMRNRDFVLRPVRQIIPDRKELFWKRYITGQAII